MNRSRAIALIIPKGITRNHDTPTIITPQKPLGEFNTTSYVVK